jgi:hypothetical protein
MRNLDCSIKEIAVAGAVALERRAALVYELTAALPEARVIDEMAHDPSARVITFELLSEED